MDSNVLPGIFGEIVHLEHFVQLVTLGKRNMDLSVGQLEHRIARRLDAMVKLRQSAGIFVMKKYSQGIHRALRQAANTDVTTQIFTDYCHFQGQIFMLDHHPDLVARFRTAGLPEWATLTVDKETLYPFAEELMQCLGSAADDLYETTTTDPEDAHGSAELIMMTADLFGIKLPVRLRDLVDWYMRMKQDHEPGHVPVWFRSTEAVRAIAA